MRKDDAYLLDILLAARKVLQYAGSMKQEEFDGSELVQDAVMRQLEIMGEAAGEFPTNIARHTKRFPGIRSPVCATRSFTNTFESIVKSCGTRFTTICQI